MLTGWKLALGVTLVLASVVVYSAQLIIFGRTGDTFYYMLQDLAFVPVQALLVTLVLDQLFKRREKMALRQKMNMVIGAFFSEAGTRLLKSFSSFDAGAGEINGRLRLGAEWTAKDFISARSAVQAHGFGVDTQRGDLPALKGFLHDRRPFLLGLLENPNLLEHDSFTELLWAVFHLTEELGLREDLNALAGTDREHLANDIKRAYALLISEWLMYNAHLKESYPYMYSLVVRTNPFDPKAAVEFLD